MSIGGTMGIDQEAQTANNQPLPSADRDLLFGQLAEPAGANEFCCPQCNSLVRTPPVSTGKKGRCPKCKAVFEIPGGTASLSQPQTVEPVSAIEFRCSQCNSLVRTPSVSRGKKGRCPKCKAVFEIPGGAVTSSQPQPVSTGEVATNLQTEPGLSKTAIMATTEYAFSPLTASQVGKLSGKFGHYQIVKLLGEGAMGAVYLARDLKLDRLVAIKVPIIASHDRAKVLKRFHFEARAVAALQHANICPIFEVSEVDGIHYIAMAYIEGASLSTYLKAGKQQPVKHVVKLVRNLALALQVAHEAGVIHRDLKPDNIMINKRGEPLIMDFGVARREGIREISLTSLDQVIGTPAYMSPEQVAGQKDKMGPCCDIWSLGVILYELLTGQLPLSGKSVPAMLSAIVKKKPPPPSQQRAEIDSALDAICLKAMEKKSDDRYQSMSEFARVLTDYYRRS